MDYLEPETEEKVISPPQLDQPTREPTGARIFSRGRVMKLPSRYKASLVLKTYMLKTN
jgi:hypothetical protein